jgi:hypothetical protein
VSKKDHDSDSSQHATNGGNMLDHMQRYKQYIDGLKSGKRSGISAVFGSAAEIFPTAILPKPESFAEVSGDLVSALIKSEREVAPVSGQTLDAALPRDEEVADNDNRQVDPVGRRVVTENGEAEVLSVFLENGLPMYMLSDLSVIDEKTFRESAIEDGQSELEEQAASGDLASGKLVPGGLTSDLPRPLTELAVAAPNGAALWQVYFGDYGPEHVFMADGGVIQRAEASDQFVYSSYQSGQSKFYILSGLVVDPNTGNIFIEVGGGMFASAFLNNGWTVEQFRQADGRERYFVRGPVPTDRPAVTVEVTSLKLDMATGEVSYQTLDGAVSMSLKSRPIL